MATAMSTKILIIGGTGFIGKFIVEASAKAGHPTFALVRESSLLDPAKSPIIEIFKTLGVNIVPVRKSVSFSFMFSSTCPFFC